VSSQAWGIDTLGQELWVVGYAQPQPGRYETVMWHLVVPEPSSILALLTGLAGIGAVARRKRR
jgi:hypothetical protein